MQKDGIYQRPTNKRDRGRTGMRPCLTFDTPRFRRFSAGMSWPLRSFGDAGKVGADVSDLRIRNDLLGILRQWPLKRSTTCPALSKRRLSGLLEALSFLGRARYSGISICIELAQKMLARKRGLDARSCSEAKLIQFSRNVAPNGRILPNVNMTRGKR